MLIHAKHTNTNTHTTTHRRFFPDKLEAFPKSYYKVLLRSMASQYITCGYKTWLIPLTPIAKVSLTHSQSRTIKCCSGPWHPNASCANIWLDSFRWRPSRMHHLSIPRSHSFPKWMTWFISFDSYLKYIIWPISQRYDLTHSWLYDSTHPQSVNTHTHTHTHTISTHTHTHTHTHNECN